MKVLEAPSTNIWVQSNPEQLKRQNKRDSGSEECGGAWHSGLGSYPPPIPFHPLLTKMQLNSIQLPISHIKKLPTCPPRHSQTATPGVFAAESPTPATGLACVRRKAEVTSKGQTESKRV